jgi:hypothetical protein
MQLHQKVRAHRHVKSFGQVRGFDPGLDAANARHIGLYDGTRALLQILTELHRVVHRLAHRHGNGGVLAQLAVARHVFGGQGLFDPRQTQPIESPSTAHHLGAVETLVGIGHQVKARTHRITHSTQARHVFAHMRAADLDLGAFEALRLRLQRLVHQRLG